MRWDVSWRLGSLRLRWYLINCFVTVQYSSSGHGGFTYDVQVHLGEGYGYLLLASTRGLEQTTERLALSMSLITSIDSTQGTMPTYVLTTT